LAVKNEILESIEFDINDGDNAYLLAVKNEKLEIIKYL